MGTQYSPRSRRAGEALEISLGRPATDLALEAARGKAPRIVTITGEGMFNIDHCGHRCRAELGLGKKAIISTVKTFEHGPNLFKIF